MAEYRARWAAWVKSGAPCDTRVAGLVTAARDGEPNTWHQARHASLLLIRIHVRGSCVRLYNLWSR
ncbi:hypothetical protein D3C81_662000 [compost metagenome]